MLLHALGPCIKTTGAKFSPWNAKMVLHLSSVPCASYFHKGTHAFLGSAYLPESTKPFHVLVNKLISTLHVWVLSFTSDTNRGGRLVVHFEIARMLICNKHSSQICQKKFTGWYRSYLQLLWWLYLRPPGWHPSPLCDDRSPWLCCDTTLGWADFHHRQPQYHGKAFCWSLRIWHFGTNNLCITFFWGRHGHYLQINVTFHAVTLQIN